ncbi:MAG: P-loop NTPase [Chlorobi bacterium]|nr:P-loop NTPase [Chlorobiota bacterium]
MPVKIAIASGKGGTGKTTVSVNLFHFIRQLWTNRVALVDCDVEEPNDLIFFPGAKLVDEKDATLPVPEIITDKCTFCRRCVEYCEFNAIVVIPPVKFAEINPSLCHSCGACLVACRDDAIVEKPYSIGKIRKYAVDEQAGIVEGLLKIGSAMQTSLIKIVKKEPVHDAEVILYDAPPGTSCPVVTTTADANYIILVTEPTPFGLHDLKLTVSLLKELEKPFGVIVNKAGLGNREIYKYLEEENIELIGEIPFDKTYASGYARGELLSFIPKEMETVYRKIVTELKEKVIDYA